MTRHPLKIMRREMRGAGDLVHAIAGPVAGVIDAIAGTRLKTCSACQKRREAWNKRIPFG